MKFMHFLMVHTNESSMRRDIGNAKIRIMVQQLTFRCVLEEYVGKMCLGGRWNVMADMVKSDNTAETSQECFSCTTIR